MSAKQKNILYSVANNSDGVLVNAIDAVKACNYFCPVCDSELILRKSGNIGKNCKRPHFAHKILTQNCTPETALHYAFKNIAYQEINRLLSDDSPLEFGWACQFCTEQHQGDLLKKIVRVELEYNLDVCQPDIALFDEAGNVFAVIEVIVTHKPEKQALDYYEDNNIILVQYVLSDDLDLIDFDNKLSRPDSVSTCFNPKCNECGRYLHKLKMMIIDAPCYKCGSELKCATIHSPDGGCIRGHSNFLSPGHFTEEEIIIARSLGVVLKKRFGKTSGYSYLANTCSHCNSFIGNHYLFIDYISHVGYGDMKSVDYDLGYHCEHCSAKTK